MGSPVRSPAPGAHRERSEERGQEGNREDTGLAGVGIHWGQRRRLESRVCALALPTPIERKSQVQSIAQFEAGEARPPFLILGGVPTASLQDRGSGQHRCPRGRRCGFPELARVSPPAWYVVRLPPPWGTEEREGPRLVASPRAGWAWGGPRKKVSRSAGAHLAQSSAPNLPESQSAHLCLASAAPRAAPETPS